MSGKQTKRQIFESFLKKTRKMSWDSLAYTIMTLESNRHKVEHNAKALKTLDRKLEVLETEKEIRVLESFDPQKFLSKDQTYEEEDSIPESFYEDLDI